MSESVAFDRSALAASANAPSKVKQPEKYRGATDDPSNDATKVDPGLVRRMEAVVAELSKAGPEKLPMICGEQIPLAPKSVLSTVLRATKMVAFYFPEKELSACENF